MKNKRYFQVLWVFTILVVITLSCSFGLGALEDEIEDSINTEVEELVTNADAISTQVESMVTDMDLEGMVTDMDLEGMVTDMDLEGMVTDMDLEAIVTDVDFDNLFGSGGEKPADIPVMEGFSEEFYSSTLVEYVINVALTEVVAYYEREMLVNGWTKVEAESKVQADSAELVFQKGGREAKISIEKDFFSDGMYVSIEITGG